MQNISKKKQIKNGQIFYDNKITLTSRVWI